jgi:hypothetical protein
MHRQFILSDVGSDALGNTKTWVTVEDTLRPLGGVCVTISTTYNKARKPEQHVSKLRLVIEDRAKLAELAAFLLGCAVSTEGVPIDNIPKLG